VAGKAAIAGIEEVVGRAGESVPEHGAGPPFCAAHHLQPAIIIQICKNRILTVAHFAYGHTRPWLSHSLNGRVQINPHLATFFPRSHEVEKSIVIYISELDPGRSGRTGVNDMPLPDR
jgi:hypothetical protein